MLAMVGITGARTRHNVEEAALDEQLGDHGDLARGGMEVARGGMGTCPGVAWR